MAHGKEGRKSCPNKSKVISISLYIHQLRKSRYSYSTSGSLEQNNKGRASPSGGHGSLLHFRDCAPQHALHNYCMRSTIREGALGTRQHYSIFRGIVIIMIAADFPLRENLNFI